MVFTSFGPGDLRKIPGFTRAARLGLSILALCAGSLTTSCAADLQSPRYRIHYSGFTGIDSDIDVAWEMASNLAYLDANRAHREYILVEFQPEIRWHGRAYAGLTTETMVRVRWHGDCILGPNSALIHELVHVALYLQDGDPDAEHKHHDWALIDGLHVPCRLP